MIWHSRIGNRTARVAGRLIALLAVGIADAALAQNGTVTGLVTHQVTGAPLPGVTVGACSAAAACTTTTTNGAGAYSISRPPGPHYLYAEASGDALVDEIYSDVPCAFSCQSEVRRGASSVIISGFTISGRDFALAPAARITGRVVDAVSGSGLSGVAVRALQSGSGELINRQSTVTDASGQYAIAGLAAGRYYVATDVPGITTSAYVDELLGDVMCRVPCSQLTSPGAATAVEVAIGATVSVGDIALSIGATISGRLTDSATGLPLSRGVLLVTRLGDTFAVAGEVNADNAGQFTLRGLAPGSYFAVARGTFTGYADEVYDNLLCLGGCTPEFAATRGLPVTVGPGTNRTGIDFALARSGGMSGMVTDAVTNQPLANASVRFFRVEGSGLITPSFSVTTNGDGLYFWPGLEPGTYYVQASHGEAMIETYQGTQCPRPCPGPGTALGTPVTVQSGVYLTGIDFQLDRGARIQGSVLDSSGSGIKGIAVRVYRQAGAGVELVHEVLSGAKSTSSTDGTYLLGGLAAGTYYLVTADRRSFPVYVDELYGSPHCSRCEGPAILGAAPIALPVSGLAIANFTLDVGFNVSGTVRDASGTHAIAGVTVNAYAVSQPSRLAGSVVSGADGRFVITGLAGSAHVFATAGPSQYLHEAFNNVPCPDGICTGPFSVTAGVAVGQPLGYSGYNFNFTLAERNDPPAAPTGLAGFAAAFNVQLGWMPAAGGSPATSYVLEAGTSPGTTAVSLPVATNALAVPGVGPGVYWLRVRGVNGFGIGAPSPEFALVVLANGGTPPPVPENVEAWTIGSRLTMTWTDPEVGAAPTGYRVEAGTAPGAANVGAIEVPARNFTFEATPPGFYFVRVRARLGGELSAASSETMIVVGGVPAPPTAPQQFASNVSSSTVNFTWAEPVAGVPTSYRLEAGSAPGLSNLATLETGNSATSLVVPGVPPGTYFVRLRARNSIGLSVATAERVVVVP
jgi:hypothetical protein